MDTPVTVATSGAIALEAIDRQNVRELARVYFAFLNDAQAAGQNVYQASLDWQDRLNAFTGQLSPADLETFLSLWVEELNASTKAINDHTNAVVAKNAEQTRSAATVISLVIFFVTLITLIHLLKH
jgi:hypothetical protein